MSLFLKNLSQTYVSERQKVVVSKLDNKDGGHHYLLSPKRGLRRVAQTLSGIVREQTKNRTKLSTQHKRRDESLRKERKKHETREREFTRKADSIIQIEKIMF
jgi:hypothetical protein